MNDQGSLLFLLGGETTPCKTPHFQWIYGKWKMLDDILINQHSCYSKSAQTLSVLFSGLLFFLPVLYASTFFAFCCKNWLKGCCNMLVNGISRYFEANFEVSLLCYFFAWTFCLHYFFTLLTTMSTRVTSFKSQQHQQVSEWVLS